MICSHDYARLYHRGLRSFEKVDRRRMRRELAWAVVAVCAYVGALCVCGVPW